MFGPLTRLLAGRTLWLLVGLLVLIEAIFIAESFTTLMAIVVSNGGSVWDILLLLLLKTPEIVDFALPLAILIGLYFAIKTARDESELVVYAAAGVSWWRIPQFALGVGLAGMLISILFAGYITPTANYAQRLTIHFLETRRVVQEITSPSPQNTIRRIKDRMIIATPPTDKNSQRGNLFVFETVDDDGWRVSQARDWEVDGPEEDGSYSIQLNSFRDYIGQTEKPAVESPPNKPTLQLDKARLQVNNLALDFRIEELVRAIDRGRRPHERMLHAPNGANTAFTGVINRRLGEVLGRAIVCLLAAGAAVAMAAWSARRVGHYLSLPLGVVIVMGGDIIARTLLGDLGHGAATGFIYYAIGALAVAAAVPLIYPTLRREYLIAPVRGRD